MNTIIFPTDFSESAQNAIDYGMSLFSNEACNIILLHAFYLPYALPGENLNLPDAKQAYYENLFEAELKRINKKFPAHKHNIIKRIETGHVVSAVNYIEQTEQIQAVVIGTRGADKKDDALVGNQVLGVVKNVMSPVLVIPDEAQFAPVTNILLTTDLLSPEGSVHLELLREIVKNNHSKVTVLHIRNKDEQNTFISAALKKEIHHQLEGIPHNFEKVIGSNAAKVISEYIKERPMDMVVTLSKNGNLFTRIFRKSLSEELTLHSHIPLLVVQNN